MNEREQFIHDVAEMLNEAVPSDAVGGVNYSGTVRRGTPLDMKTILHVYRVIITTAINSGQVPKVNIVIGGQ